MTLLQLLFPGRSSRFLALYYNFVGVTLILLQYNNSVVNSSQIQDLNLTNSDYVSEILRRTKRQAVACEIPNYGHHIKYTILGENAVTYQPGNYAQEYFNLEVSCDRGYNLKPFSDKRTICINGKWNPPLTVNCLRTCPSLKSTMSTKVTCIYDNIPLENCNNPIENTTASLSCNPLFEQDNSQKRLCKEGRWTPSILECYPICGTKRPKGVPNIVNGKTATVGDYPWQIAIYNAEKDFSCGGSILDRHIVLTAAHCLADHNGKANPTTNYLVAAGKYYRKYDDDRDEFAQYSKVQHIYIPERYTGPLNHYALDIAIIILANPFTISLRVQPVCIELDEKFSKLYLSSKSIGIATGWGYTQEGRDLAEVLKELEIPFIPYRQCFDEVPSEFRQFVTPDKICGGYLNKKTNVCAGDSGGALVFQNNLTDRYYVKGVVSTSPATRELVCDSNQYSLYTSVEEHVDFIKNVRAYNQMAHSIEFINETTDEIGLDYHSCSSERFISEMLQQASSTPPQIIPKVAEFTINASSTFELRCLSKNFVTWTTPSNLEEIFSNENLTKYSTITIKSSKCDSVYESRLTINNASYLDVGFYYCHENTTDSIKTSSIYIYVYDDQKLLLLPEFNKREVSENSTVILPCRPSAPDIHVKLLLNSYIGPIEIPLDSKDHDYVTYDSKRGFTYTARKLNKIRLPSINFTCSFSRGSYEEFATIELFTKTILDQPQIQPISNEPLAILDQPQIQQISNEPLVVRQRLELACATVELAIKLGDLLPLPKSGTPIELNLSFVNVASTEEKPFLCIAENDSHLANYAGIFIKSYV